MVFAAYLSAKDHYVRFEEIAGGKGFIDMLFVPRRGNSRPAMVVELKCAHSAEDAVSQIKDRRYANALKKFEYSGSVLLVGISYDTKSKLYSCSIESISL